MNWYKIHSVPTFYCDHGVFEYDVAIFSEIVDNFAGTNLCWKTEKLYFVHVQLILNYNLIFENRTRHK